MVAAGNAWLKEMTALYAEMAAQVYKLATSWLLLNIESALQKHNNFQVSQHVQQLWIS